MVHNKSIKEILILIKKEYNNTKHYYENYKGLCGVCYELKMIGDLSKIDINKFKRY